LGSGSKNYKTLLVAKLLYGFIWVQGPWYFFRKLGWYIWEMKKRSYPQPNF